MRNIRQILCVGLLMSMAFSPLFDLLQLPQLTLTSSAFAAPQQQLAPTDTQSSDLFLKELETIYLTNLERRKHGLAPLRWNRQLQEAARWFAADAVEHNAYGFCSHTDSNGQTPGQRFQAFGYRNAQAWGENVICGFTEPRFAVAGWMNSAGHRANLLHSDYREIGVGYYQQGDSGRGYVTQDLSVDNTYAPVIINNEALSTTENLVDLYIYAPAVGEGLQGMGTAIELMIANEPDFINAQWEPFTHEKQWRLEEGEGWRSVYVKTRDLQGRTSTVFDTIYVGRALPVDELDLRQGCGSRPQLDIEALDQSGWPQVQLSLNWLGDNEDSTFQDSMQIGHRIVDPDAIGQSTYFLAAGSSGRVRYWTTSFYKDVPLVAYFRIKVGAINTDEQVLAITINGGGTAYGPLIINGTDFAEADSYQEFVLPFQFHTNADDPYLTFNIDHAGKSDIYLDTISIFTESISVQREIEWQVFGGYHRSRGIWARFVEPSGAFTAPTEIQVFGANQQIVVPPTASVPPARLPIVDPTELTHHLFIPITMR